MAAIATFAELQELINSGNRGSQFSASNGNASFSISTLVSSWANYNLGGIAPSAPVALDQSNAGALLKHPRLPGTSSKSLWLVEAEFMYGGPIAGNKACAILYDRLSHMGGLDGTATTAQTTNLPTAALTRYTDGVGVGIFLETFASIGNTGTTIQLSYTNQAGVAGQLTPPMLFGGTAAGGSNSSILPVALADGDTGCRSVESVTIAATTGVVGNFGVVLMKRLGLLPPDTGSMVERQAYRQMFFGGGIVEILPDACLTVVFNQGSSTTGQHYPMGNIGIAEK